MPTANGQLTNDELDAKIAATEQELRNLKAMRVVREGMGLVSPPPAASIPMGGRVWNYDERGLLNDGWTQGAFSRIDPVIDDTCPTGVYLEKTGHYLSIPRPDLGERFPAYAERVSRQAGVIGIPTNIGALFISSGKHFARFGGYKADGSNWPLVADYYFNRYPYQTDAERAADAQARLDWEAAQERMRTARR